MFTSLVPRFFSRSLLLLTCLTLLSGFGAVSLVGTAHASAVTDPLVVVAEDQTTSSCVTTDTRYVGTTTAIASSRTYPCLPGTVMASVVLPRSQALSEGRPFVIIPASNASLATWKQFSGQVSNLVKKQRDALRQKHSRYDLALTPLSTCGWNWSRAEQTPINGDMIYSVFYSYENADCVDNNLQHTTIKLTSSYNNALWWQSFLDFDNCCFLPPEEWDTTCPSVAPQNFTYNLGLGNENENDGHDIGNQFSSSPCDGHGNGYYLDFGNL